MYSLTRLSLYAHRCVLGGLVVLALSLLAGEGAEGRSKAKRFDPVPASDSVIEYDAVIGYDSARGRAQAKRHKSRGPKSRGGKASDRVKNTAGSVARLVFTHTRTDGVSSGELARYRGRRNYYGDEEFSLATTRDMSITTYWKHLDGEQTQTLLIYSPEGHVFQKRIVPFTTTPRVGHRRRRMRGIDHPVDVRHARATDDQNVVTVQFPIAGTWVSQHQMVGLWKVEVYHNEAKIPSGSGSFTLTE